MHVDGREPVVGRVRAPNSRHHHAVEQRCDRTTVHHARRLLELGATAVTRRERLSDNGNPILDAHYPAITDPSAFAVELSQIPGIVEHGIFPERMVERVVVAAPSGVRELTR